MKLLLITAAITVAAAGSLLVAGFAAPQRRPEAPAPVLLTPDNGLMPEVTVFAPRPEMVVDEVVVTAARPDSGRLCTADECANAPVAN